MIWCLTIGVTLAAYYATSWTLDQGVRMRRWLSVSRSHPAAPQSSRPGLPIPGPLLRLVARPARLLLPWMRRGTAQPWWERCRWKTGLTARLLIGREVLLTVEDALARGVVLALLLGGMVAWIAPWTAPLGAISGAWMGAGLPWWWAARVRRRWRIQLTRELELTLDLLALALEAGIALPLAIAQLVAQRPPSPLGGVLQRLHYDLRLGCGTPQAWQRLAVHADTPAVDALVALLLQADRLGTPVAVFLRGQATRLRETRLRDIQRRGAIAGHKILVPIVVCIVPAYFLLVFGGLLVRLLTQGVAGVLW